MDNLSLTAQLLTHFGVDSSAARIDEMAESLDSEFPSDWRLVASVLPQAMEPQDVATGSPRVLGISGGQGAGKTTLSLALVQALARRGMSAVACSLDDFYLGKAERQLLATQQHPLLATRGVPGTHRVKAAAKMLDDFHRGADILVPRFDKAIDDIAPESQWQWYRGPIDCLIFEGWCLGVQPQPQSDLVAPINELERRQDADGRWRRHVNDALERDYGPLWSRLDKLLYLAVPDIDAVRRWRGQQELNLPPQHRMSDSAVRQFIAYYERLTRWMLVSMPATATWTLPLDPDHRISGSEMAPFRSGSDSRR